MNRLQGLTVLVTRPSPSGELLCEHIQQQGGKAIHLPTIAFAPPHDGQVFLQALATLGEQDWLIFISPQAVYASIPSIRQQWPHFPPHVKLAAVGSGTAKALTEAGYIVEACPRIEWNSEGLLELEIFQQVQGKNIMIVRGEGGRDILANTLTARGAHLSHLIAYERVLPSINTDACEKLLAAHQIDAVVCTSCDGVRHYKQLLPASWLFIKEIPMVVMSERIKILARDLDFQTIWVTRNASPDAILEILAERKEELCQNKRTKSSQK